MVHTAQNVLSAQRSEARRRAEIEHNQFGQVHVDFDLANEMQEMQLMCMMSRDANADGKRNVRQWINQWKANGLTASESLVQAAHTSSQSAQTHVVASILPNKKRKLSVGNTSNPPAANASSKATSKCDNFRKRGHNVRTCSECTVKVKIDNAIPAPAPPVVHNSASLNQPRNELEVSNQTAAQ